MTKQNHNRRKGSSITEFALIAPLLFALLIGAFSLGNGVSRLVQASTLCRNANVLVVRGFDMAKNDNQKLLVRTGSGLGLSQGSNFAPDPNGKAVIFLTKVVKVGLKACAEGVPNWNGDAASCPNFQKYVIASRIAIGNGARWQSATGNPVSSTNGKGELSDYNIAMIAGNRATNFSDSAGQQTIVKLFDDEFAYVAEVFVDASDLNVPFLIDLDTIRVRNVS